MVDQGTITALLAEAEPGDPKRVFDRLLPLVYEELRSMARRQLWGERSNTLDATGLVHECYLRLVDQTRVPIQSRRYFFGAAARAMRLVLVDAARKRTSQKRGGGKAPETLDEAHGASDRLAEELLDLDEALSQLGEQHGRAARVVECRYFAGMTVDETAEALAISKRTVERDWTLARSWLHSRLGDRGRGVAAITEDGLTA